MRTVMIEQENEPDPMWMTNFHRDFRKKRKVMNDSNSFNWLIEELQNFIRFVQDVKAYSTNTRRNFDGE